MNFPPEVLKEYREALRDSVCSKCWTSGYERSCRVGKLGVCPVDVHLPRLIEAVLTTPRSPKVSDYIPRIRELVCSHCENQDEYGACQARNLTQCGLDSFVVLAVQTIEDVYDRLHPRARTPTGESLSQ